MFIDTRSKSCKTWTRLTYLTFWTVAPKTGMTILSAELICNVTMQFTKVVEHQNSGGVGTLEAASRQHKTAANSKFPPSSQRGGRHANSAHDGKWKNQRVEG